MNNCDTISYKNQDYTLIVDFVSLAENTKTHSDSTSFIFDSIEIDNKEYNFINQYEEINKAKNPIGLWQTILQNYKFDYSKDFKYQFKLDELGKKVFAFSFTRENGWTINSNPNLINLSDFEEITIDFSQFVNLTIIQTAAEKKQEKRKNLTKIITIFTIFYLIVIAVMSFYYYQKNTKYKQQLRILNNLNTKTDALRNELAQKLSNTVELKKLKTSYIIDALKTINATSITLLSVDTNFSNDIDKVVITTELADIKKIKKLANNLKFDVLIKRDFVKNIATITLIKKS